MIEWRQVGYSVRSGFWLRRESILEDFSLAVPKNTVLGIIGPNGAGKTTLLQIGAGILTPDTGQVIYGNDARPLTRKSIGFLAELQYFPLSVKSKEWLFCLGQLSGCDSHDLEKQIEYYSQILGLESLLDKQMKSLSKGQAQRVGIAQALISDPEILLLDEPMTGLDPYWRMKVRDALLSHRDNEKTIVFSSHILSDVEELCDGAIFINQGRILWQGSIAELLEQVLYYRVICAAENRHELRQWAVEHKMTHFSGTDFGFNLDPAKKKDFLGYVGDKQIDLRSLTPVLKKIDDVFSEIRS